MVGVDRVLRGDEGYVRRGETDEADEGSAGIGTSGLTRVCLARGAPLAEGGAGSMGTVMSEAMEAEVARMRAGAAVLGSYMGWEAGSGP